MLRSRPCACSGPVLAFQGDASCLVEQGVSVGSGMPCPTLSRCCTWHKLCRTQGVALQPGASSALNGKGCGGRE